MNPINGPLEFTELNNTIGKDLVEAMSYVWENPGIPTGVGRTVRIHTAIIDIRRSKRHIVGIPAYTVPHSKREADMFWLYKVISNFIEDKRKKVEGDACEERNPVKFLDVCATTTQLHGMRVKKMVRLLQQAEKGWLATAIRGSPWVTSDHPLSDLFNREWNILIPRLRERVEKIAWQIHMGQHNYRPSGEEWQNIEKFYGGLGHRVTMTRCTVPRLLKEVYIATRPVDASERGPWPQRRETEECDSGKAGAIQAVSRCVPISYQHWALVVKEGDTSAIWELGVVEGRIKIDKSEQDYPEPSHMIPVGYTDMSNDEISALAADACKDMGNIYNFSTFNCQLFCNKLFQFIRVSHSVSDAFSDLRALPDDRVVQVVTKRLQQLGTTTCVDPSEIANLQPMPIFFGTLYTRALIVAAVSILVYVFTTSRFDLFCLVAVFVAMCSPFATRHTNLYPWSTKRDPDPKRLRRLYYAVNTREESVDSECLTQSLGSQQEVFRQSGRIMEIDDQDEDRNCELKKAEVKSIRLIE